MVIDMHAPGASRCGRCAKITGHSDFNEVFFNEVFVPDDDVVGTPDDGWTVARSTLGNERVSIGGGSGGIFLVPWTSSTCWLATVTASPTQRRVGRTS